MSAEQDVKPAATPAQPEPAKPAESTANLFDLGETGYTDPAETPPEPTPTATSVASPAPAPTPEPAPAPSPPKHSPRLVNLAQQLGFSDDEITQTEPSQLYDLVRMEYDLRARQEPPAPPKEEEIDWGTTADGRKLTEADYDPPMARTIKLMHETAKKNRELEAKLAAQEQRSQQREQQTYVEHLDSLFGSREDLFGKGTVQDVKRGTPEFDKRAAIETVMRTLPGSLQAKFEKAVTILYGSAPAAPPPERPRGENGRYVSDKWQEAALQKPTQRDNAAEPFGRERAIRSVTKKMRGVDAPIIDDSETLNSFPG